MYAKSEPPYLANILCNMVKKSRKCKVEQAKACLDANSQPWKLNMLMKTRFASFAMFQQGLKF